MYILALRRVCVCVCVCTYVVRARGLPDVAAHFHIQ